MKLLIVPGGSINCREGVVVVSIGGGGGGWGRCSQPTLEHSRIQKQVLHERGTVPAHRDTHQTEQHSLVARKMKVALQETHVHKASVICRSRTPSFCWCSTLYQLGEPTDHFEP